MRGLAAGLCALAAALCPAPAALAQQRPVEVQYSFWPPAYALEQQRAFEKALATVAPQRPGVRDVYILAAGLYGGHVFQNEASQGAAALANHFRADGRMIVLSNDHTPGATLYPASTPAHIQAALGRIAEVMDKDQDVAVIFLTSHGAQNAGIAGHEPNLAGEGVLSDFMITPGALRGALDAAGIKNRIVILSACFAGQFIPTLQDPHTIVLTAASQDRTSFGCQAERDWTYFGDAFFNEALPQSASLIDAFDKAKSVIGGWESQGNLTPSEPQSFIGAQTKFLSEIEK
jgi:hypothetical protein